MPLQTRTIIISISLLMAFYCLPAEAWAQSVKGITPGRAWSIVGGIIALMGLIMGWRAKRRAGSGRRTQALIALSLGGIAIILSVIHLTTSAGAVLGSGSGKAGAIIALILALMAIFISGKVVRSKGR